MISAIVKLSGKTPVVKDTLYMRNKYSEIRYLANFDIIIRMFFISIALLLSRLDIAFRISFLVFM